ncbi:hypothetical protein [Pseudoroseomonas cervicalis]|uniref:hypothetical protein n=1 Tax=Teichococcus cervicalis TaxID=204525 RepID=UPI002787743A|nr:hypothetical protein [Pseudoroseomonas cervicalis]MDQ1077975.1 hypothetical protein [Pseudoroseomonas cervicalis]
MSERLWVITGTFRDPAGFQNSMSALVLASSSQDARNQLEEQLKGQPPFSRLIRVDATQAPDALVLKAAAAIARAEGRAP